MTIDLDDLEKKALAAVRHVGGDWHLHHTQTTVWAPGAGKAEGMPAHIFDVRGWGYLTGGAALGLSSDEAFQQQCDWAEFVASANPAVILEMIRMVREK